MIGSYHPWLVALSVVIAVITSYTALDLASRLTESRGRARAFWLLGGAGSMGIGIWAMHFIGMLAFDLPIPLAYDIPITLGSVVPAVLASALALLVMGRESTSRGHLLASACLIGLGIATMHYTGMAALRMSPPIRYDPMLFALSVLIAIAASWVALQLAIGLRPTTGAAESVSRKLAAAIVMGLAIAGMHYTGMAAAHFDPGSVCTAAPMGVDPTGLAILVGGGALLVFLLTIATSALDTMLERRATVLAKVMTRDLEESRAQLQASEKSLRQLATVVEQTDDLVSIAGRSGMLEYVNPSFERLTGYAAAEVIGRSPSILKSGQHDREFYRRLWETVRAGRPFREVFVNRKKSGELYYEAKTISPIHNERGEITHFVSTGKDVTERMQAEATVRKLARARDVMAECNRILVHATEEAGMLKDMCTTVVVRGGYRMAWVGYAEHDAAKSVRPVAQAGFEEGYLATAKIGWADNERGRGPTGTAIRSGKSVFVKRILDNPDFAPWREDALKRGYASALALPLSNGSGVIGALNIYAGGADAFDTEEVALLQELASDIAYGIGALRTRVARAKAESEHKRLLEAVEASLNELYIFDPDTLRFRYVNPSARRNLGYSAESLSAMTPVDLKPDFNAASFRDLIAPLLSGEQNLMVFETSHRRADGSLYPVEVHLQLVGQGAERVFLALILDIAERKRTERALIEAEELLRQLAGNVPEAFWVREVGSEAMLYVSPGWFTITGWPAASDQQAMLDVVHSADSGRVLAAAAKAPSGGYDDQYRIVRPDGVVRWLHVRTFPILNDAKEVYRVAGVAEDITEEKVAKERLLQMAHYDALTNLPNRTLFYDSLKRTLGHAEQNQYIVGLLFIDLDRFKVVNDTLGHATGDALLQQVGSRLLECVRIRDVVGRLGGDEFALILPALDAADDAAAVAIKIIQAFSKPFDLDGREVFISASIGITVYPADASDVDTLLRYADTAMYRAKEEGRNAYRYYTAQMNARAEEKLELENALRHALERNEFLLHYQPKLDLESGEISGVEALIRWQRLGAGLVSPVDFIPLLEETGLIIPVGAWVIAEACRQIMVWERQGVKPVPIAVNLSGRQFHQENLSGLITQAVREHGVRPELLEFELTESSLMSQAEETIRILEELKASGGSISVDDFGTGYSSLGYLKRFPINVIKIDRSFISDIMSNWEDASLALAIIGIAHNLGMKVVAEGVETLEQLEFLAKNGCNEIQGYLFHRPMSAAAITALLRDNGVSDNRTAALGKASYREAKDVAARIAEYQRAVRGMREGVFDAEISVDHEDEIGQLGRELSGLARELEQRFEEANKLQQIAEEVTAGLFLEDILNRVYDSFRRLIPYDRIGCALLSDENRMLTAYWAKSDAPNVMIGRGHSAPMAGSSLERVLETGEPRILNDLEAYLAEHPNSASTVRIVAEGMRSSLTCPLLAQGKPVGFLFFSSMQKNTFRDLHQDLFLRIAGQLSVLVEKSRLYEQIVELNQKLLLVQRTLAEQTRGEAP